MAGNTSHYNFKRLNTGDNLYSDSAKFTWGDREQMDALIYQGAEGHHHTGESSGSNPTLAPTLALDDSSGSLSGSTTYYYCYTYVDSAGLESSPSPVASQATSSAVTSPTAPALATSPTGGVLLPGQYFYVLTAYQSSNTVETKGLSPNTIVIPVGTSTNRVTLTLPSLPSGATGFNIYRKKPGGLGMFYLDSVDLNVATPPTTYVDDGNPLEDCTRTLPSVNSTNSTNNITITLPGATPVIPAGYTWKIYRSTVAGSFTNAFLTQQTVNPYYVDTGTVTTAGSPPVYSQFTTTPSKVLLTDAAEVQGTLPMGVVSGFPFIVEFNTSGAISAASQPFVWICEFPNFYVNWCRITLGTAGTSSTTIVDVNKGPSSATPTLTTIYTTQANRPMAQTGQKRGVATVPDVHSFVLGDAMTVDIDQAGGGSPANLKVLVYGFAYGFDDDTSFVP